MRLHYKKPIITLAILIDNNPKWRPQAYRLIVLDQTVHHFTFNTVKLLDYRGQEESLRNSDNPFAWIVLVQLTALDAQDDVKQRLQHKIRLTRLLYRRHFTKEDIVKLYAFIDWVLTLPKGLETLYNDDIEKFEEEKKMPFITGMEQRGIDKGLKLGLQQGEKKGERKGERKKALKIAKKMLVLGLDLKLIKKVTGLPQEELEALINKH